MKIFVTGGSGFIGGHLIEALAPRHELWAMARSERSAEVVRQRGAQPVICELGQVSAEDLRGCEVVIHCAAYAEEWGRREVFEAFNVEGTRQLLEVARAAGVKRFVHMGTEAALFDGHDLEGVDEEAPYPARHRFLYSETKARAEALVLAASDAQMEALSLRPRLVWGPRDNTVLPVLLKMVQEGRFLWLDQGQARTSTTHVANLCHAVELALTRGRGGQAYFVADEGETTLREFLTAMLGSQGVQAPQRSLPGAVARPVGYLVGGLWRTLKLQSTPPIHGFPVAMMSRHVTVNTQKARRELGYAPKLSRQEGLAQMA